MAELTALPEQVRKDIFAALVAAQDEGHGVQPSRELVAGRFSVTPGDVKTIEQEGLDKQWPPLG